MRRRPTHGRLKRRWWAATSSSASRPRARSTRRWCASMAAKPIIFAMANPDPEITPEEVYAGARLTRSSPPGVRTIRTRSTTCLGSLTSSAGALDVRASAINEDMKIACAQALAETGARGRAGRGGRGVPGRAAAASGPATSSRRRSTRASSVAKFRRRWRRRRWIQASRACRSSTWKPTREPAFGAAQSDGRARCRSSWTRSGATRSAIVFAEGEEEARDPRGACRFAMAGSASRSLSAAEEQIRNTLGQMGLDPRTDLDIRNARTSEKVDEYAGSSLLASCSGRAFSIATVTG